MLTTTVVCDNPSCSQTGVPEHEDAKKKSYVGPYAWYSIQVNITGPGPSVHVDACSSGCIEDAINCVVERAQQEMYG